MDLTQHGKRGYGRLVLDGTNAAEAVPLALRLAGAGGTMVTFEVSGSRVTMKHVQGGQLFTARLSVVGDQMRGEIRDTNPPVYFVLTRVRPETPAPSAPTAAPVAPPPVAFTPPPEAKAPEAPEAPTVTAAAETPQETPQETPPPAATPDRPAPKEFSAAPELRSVYFDFDLSNIRPDDSGILDANVEWLKAHDDVLVLIEGHCDERGTHEHNLALGERRAQSTMEYLVARGVDASRITTVSYGEERPSCTEATEQCWSANRRAQFLVRPRDGQL